MAVDSRTREREQWASSMDEYKVCDSEVILSARSLSGSCRVQDKVTSIVVLREMLVEVDVGTAVVVRSLNAGG